MGRQITFLIIQPKISAAPEKAKVPPGSLFYGKRGGIRTDYTFCDGHVPLNTQKTWKRGVGLQAFT